MVPTLALMPRSSASRCCISTIVVSGACSTRPSRKSRCGSSLSAAAGPDGAPFAHRSRAPGAPKQWPWQLRSRIELPHAGPASHRAPHRSHDHASLGCKLAPWSPSIPQGTETRTVRTFWESLQESEKPEPALVQNVGGDETDHGNAQNCQKRAVDQDVGKWTVGINASK